MAGPGTVGLYLLDTDKRAAGSDLVDAVQKYVDPTQDGQGEGVAPAGPKVTVMPAEEVPMDIQVKLTLARCHAGGCKGVNRTRSNRVSEAACFCRPTRALHAHCRDSAGHSADYRLFGADRERCKRPEYRDDR